MLKYQISLSETLLPVPAATMIELSMLLGSSSTVRRPRRTVPRYRRGELTDVYGMNTINEHTLLVNSFNVSDMENLI